jgi:hypothetical protein
MNPTFLPSTCQLKELFAREIAALGGTVSDLYDDGSRLFARAILPQVREVRPKDQVQGGVAMRTTGGQVQVHPYLFRQVCRNGAVMAQALQTRQVQLLEESPFGSPPEYEVAEVLTEIQNVVQACCDREIFDANARSMRSAVDAEADQALNILPHLVRMTEGLGSDVVPQILERFFSHEGGRSLFGLMNAVTSLARDTQDPEIRWGLEELGGGVPALVRPRRVPDGAAMALNA